MPKLQPELSIWFDVPDDPLKGRVLIRHIQDGEEAAISAMAVDQRLIMTDGELKKETRYDLAKDNDLTICRAVMDWDNFFDSAGKEQLACTDCNKRLYAHAKWFLDFVAECRKQVREKFLADQEEKRKNLPALPSGFPEQGGKAATTAG